MYFIGTSGWSFNHWAGRFYPKDIPRQKWLEFYTENFNTVEMNMSFHRFPSENLIINWKEKLPKKFIMTVKVNREITHVKRFKDPGSFLDDFYRSVGRLENNLGCVLFQAPPTFRFSKDNFERFKTFLEKIDRKKKNVFEFRHESWWNDQILDLFKKEKLCFVSVSGFSLPNEIINTNNIVYIRFHGKVPFTSLYSEKELQKWADKIKESNAKQVFCYFNNDADANAVKNAKQLIQIL
jgi:uncharacterized protein YecE (DUF72 family)